MREITQSVGGFLTDNRAASINIGYTITIGITAVLMIGLFSGVGTVLESEQERAVLHQTEVISDQTASTVMSAERVGETGASSDVTLTQTLPTEVVGTPYFIHLRNPTGSGPVVVVNALDGEIKSETPIAVSSTIVESTVRGGSELQVIYDVNPSTGNSELEITAPDGSGRAATSSDDFRVDITDISPDPANEGDTVTVSIDVDNTGSESGTQNVALTVDGYGVVDSQDVSLNSGQGTSITLEWDSASGSGTQTVSVTSDDDSDISDFTIQ